MAAASLAPIGPLASASPNRCYPPTCGAPHGRNETSERAKPYTVAFGASAPFWVVGSWYVGPVARMLNSSDISFFVGLGLSAVIYLVLARSLDLAAEHRVEAEEGDFTAAGLHGQGG